MVAAQPHPELCIGEVAGAEEVTRKQMIMSKKDCNVFLHITADFLAKLTSNETSKQSGFVSPGSSLNNQEKLALTG